MPTLLRTSKASSTTVNTTRTSIASTASKRRSRPYWTRSRDDHLFTNSHVFITSSTFVNFIHPYQSYIATPWLITIKQRLWLKEGWLRGWARLSRAHPVIKRRVGGIGSSMIITTSTMKQIPIVLQVDWSKKPNNPNPNPKIPNKDPWLSSTSTPRWSKDVQFQVSFRNAEVKSIPTSTEQDGWYREVHPKDRGYWYNEDWYNEED